MERFLNLIVTGPNRVPFSYWEEPEGEQTDCGVLAKRRRNGRDGYSPTTRGWT